MTTAVRDYYASCSWLTVSLATRQRTTTSQSCSSWRSRSESWEKIVNKRLDDSWNWRTNETDSPVSRASWPRQAADWQRPQPLPTSLHSWRMLANGCDDFVVVAVVDAGGDWCLCWCCCYCDLTMKVTSTTTKTRRHCCHCYAGSPTESPDSLGAMLVQIFLGDAIWLYDSETKP